MKKLKWYHYIALVFTLLFIINILSPSKDESIEPIIQYDKIAQKTQTEVENLLGKGVFTENIQDKKANCSGSDCPHYKYGNLEITYINGKADWITVNDLSKFDYNENAIELVGIKQKKQPDFSNSTVIRYYNYDEFNELAIFANGNGKVSYIYIKAKTK